MRNENILLSPFAYLQFYVPQFYWFSYICEDIRAYDTWSNWYCFIACSHSNSIHVRLVALSMPIQYQIADTTTVRSALILCEHVFNKTNVTTIMLDVAITLIRAFAPHPFNSINCIISRYRFELEIFKLESSRRVSEVLELAGRRIFGGFRNYQDRVVLATLNAQLDILIDCTVDWID